MKKKTRFNCRWNNAFQNYNRE